MLRSTRFSRSFARGFVSRPSQRASARMSATLVSDVASHDSKKQELLSQSGPHFVIYSADRDPSTQLPWCPDCVRTVPAVEAFVASRGGSLLEVQVGPKSAWKTPDHPFRHEPLKLTGIPTLIALSPSGDELARLGPELEACGSPEEATALLQTFAA